MFKITIKSKQHGEFWLTKETKDEVIEYCQWAQESKHWGSPQWIEEVPEKIELVTQEDGVQVQNTIPGYQIVHPAEYTIEVEDITAQVEQERINKEALEFLAASDWYAVREFETGLKMPDEIREERAKARAQVIR